MLASDDVETDRTVSLQSDFVLQTTSAGFDKTTGSAMYAHLYHLSETIGTRRANTPQEEEARDYIYNVFEDLGYSPVIQSLHIKAQENQVM